MARPKWHLPKEGGLWSRPGRFQYGRRRTWCGTWGYVALDEASVSCERCLRVIKKAREKNGK
jgi:hypothetical protein